MQMNSIHTMTRLLSPTSESASLSLRYTPGHSVHCNTIFLYACRNKICYTPDFILSLSMLPGRPIRSLSLSLSLMYSNCIPPTPLGSEGCCCYALPGVNLLNGKIANFPGIKCPGRPRLMVRRCIYICALCLIHNPTHTTCRDTAPGE